MRLRTAAALGGLMLLLIVLGWPFIARLGIEVDEALVGNGIYERGAPWYSWHIAEHEIPVMLLPYLGAFKTWMYNAIFALWEPGPVSLRLPTLLLGGVTLLLFFRLTDESVGRAAAWIGTAMLSSDPSFVLLSAVDYGPVALQHALKLGALLLLLTFHRSAGRWRIGIAFGLLGLAMWDKAVFSWFLAGMTVAGATVFWRELKSHCSFGNLSMAVAAFSTGALPWIVYNVVRPLETFSSTARFSTEGAFVKLVLLKRTLDGSGMFNFMTAPEAGPNPGAPRSVVQHLQFWLADVTGHPQTTLTALALLAALLAVPLVWRSPVRRAVVFAAVLMMFTWAPMFITTGAGGAVHHVSLLTPFPIFAIAATATALLRERPAWILAALLCAGNLMVMNTYHVTLIRNGGSVRWTDAFGPLHLYLRDSLANTMVIADWGILETLNLVSQGELPLLDASAHLYPRLQPEVIARLLRQPGAIWVAHSEGREQWEGVNAALEKAAGLAGVRGERVHTVYDRNGRAIFDILAFRGD